VSPPLGVSPPGTVAPRRVAATADGTGTHAASGPDSDS
jgi:hypothetical protein